MAVLSWEASLSRQSRVTDTEGFHRRAEDSWVAACHAMDPLGAQGSVPPAAAVWFVVHRR